MKSLFRQRAWQLADSRGFRSTTIRAAVFAPALALALVLAVAACGDEAATTTTASVAVPGQIRAPHFVDSYPLHEEVFAQTPEVVVVNFDFDLGDGSTIEVTANGAGLTSGPTEIAESRLSMRVPLADGSDGMVLVSYTAFWPDGSSHDGSFVFFVDSAGRAEYTDLTGQREVMVDMAGLRFDPARIIVDQGTTVTWTNNEGPEHFVNSDPHPSHNVLPEFNSRGMANGETYSFTFDEPGEWGYHCSAHYPQMVGRIIVVPVEGTSSTATTVPVLSSTTTGGAATTATSAAGGDVAGPPLEDVDHVRTPHFVRSDPGHGTTVSAQPRQVSIEFDFDLGSESTITVTRDGVDVTAAATAIAGDRLSMAVPLKAGTGQGTYLVEYRAYWPDGSFHDGRFAFALE
jgi:plastocyanin